MRFSSHSQTSWNAQNSIKLQCSSMNDHTVHHLLFHFYSIIFLYSVDLLIKSRVWPFTTLRQGKKIAVKNPNRKKSCTHKVLWVTSEKNDYRKTQGNAYTYTMVIYAALFFFPSFWFCWESILFGLFRIFIRFHSFFSWGLPWTIANYLLSTHIFSLCSDWMAKKLFSTSYSSDFFGKWLKM